LEFFEEIKKENPEKIIQIWAEDEARIGLQAITRRVWWEK
jgi:hypothetical protein